MKLKLKLKDLYVEGDAIKIDFDRWCSEQTPPYRLETIIAYMDVAPRKLLEALSLDLSIASFINALENDYEIILEEDDAELTFLRLRHVSRDNYYSDQGETLKKDFCIATFEIWKG